jgi:hypothetical protein
MSRRATPVVQDALAEALRTEQEIADQAAAIRADQVGLDRSLFAKLYPLLRKPIPTGFIQSVGQVTGKPYESTGIKSVQVQIDRMNNVLGPDNWCDEVEYHENGKVARVRVRVQGVDLLIDREGWGGVDRGSTLGNIYKGSYTNAAKLAFARLGPGHEVYLGATDLDPDVHESVAKEQSKPDRQHNAPPAQADPNELLSETARRKVVKAVMDTGITDEGWQLLLARLGIEDTELLTKAHAFEVREWLDEQAARS